MLQKLFWASPALRHLGTWMLRPLRRSTNRLKQVLNGRPITYTTHLPLTNSISTGRQVPFGENMGKVTSRPGWKEWKEWRCPRLSLRPKLMMYSHCRWLESHPQGCGSINYNSPFNYLILLSHPEAFLPAGISPRFISISQFDLEVPLENFTLRSLSTLWLANTKLLHWEILQLCYVNNKIFVMLLIPFAVLIFNNHLLKTYHTSRSQLLLVSSWYKGKSAMDLTFRHFTVL